jgi:hypothetical protein
VTRKLTRAAVEAAPYEIWNCFVNLLAMEDYRDLDPVQRPAHLIFWYEHEVQNGGHLQYFENRGSQRLDETIAALGTLRAPCQQQILREAGDLYLSRSRRRFQTAEEFCSAALQGEFSEYDRRLYACKPSLPDFLDAYLRLHQSEFVIIE